MNEGPLYVIIGILAILAIAYFVIAARSHVTTSGPPKIAPLPDTPEAGYWNKVRFGGRDE